MERERGVEWRGKDYRSGRGGDKRGKERRAEEGKGGGGGGGCYRKGGVLLELSGMCS